MPGGAKGHLLTRIAGLGAITVVARHQARQMGQGILVGEASCVGSERHESVLYTSERGSGRAYGLV